MLAAAVKQIRRREAVVRKAQKTLSPCDLLAILKTA
jgi:hypothetical protein